ncbi:hypothetical protein Y032_0057g2766 [Ancylostoma ceylanicum]|uniref:Uncharacterized protein n=1 Tax=Ancylostoma ceylanicum TaxID=53326 RepID=A0A016U5B1_9BILA|nr:hypothetical protein Y032_0057g2766 [Ancylostoma ceylanicum]
MVSELVFRGWSVSETNESAQAVHFTAKSLVDIIKITMKRDTQIRYDDVDCWQAWMPLDQGQACDDNVSMGGRHGGVKGSLEGSPLPERRWKDVVALQTVCWG